MTKRRARSPFRRSDAERRPRGPDAIDRSEPAESVRDRTVVLVHGAWHGGWCWQEGFMERLVSHGWRCLAPTLRHHGPGARVRDLRCTSIGDHVDDLRSLVESLDEEALLVGHSMGGHIVQRYLADGHPAAGAVLLAPVPPSGVTAAAFRLARRHPGAFLRANATLRLRPLVATEARADDLLFGGRLQRRDLERLTARLGDESYRSFLDMLIPLRNLESSRPVAVIGGRDDAVFTVAEIEGTASAYGTRPMFLDTAHDLMLTPEWPEVADLVSSELAAMSS